jgi:hypothetical protein
MNRRNVVFRIVISLLLFFAFSYGFFDFMVVDDCLNHGGSINEVTGLCEPNGEFVPLVKRASVVFWLFVLLIGIVPASIAYWLLGNFKTDGS